MPLLNWLTRDADLTASTKAPYRLLEHVPALSFGAADTENMLIQGDNLETLKSLLPFYAGRVKCICIDPPYNTRSAFEHYDDNLEHTQWLAMMYPRLELLRELLSEDGSIWVSIDDNEAHYLKVVMDEVFGRKNFLGTVIWEKKYAPKADSKYLSASHDFILCYAKRIGAVSFRHLPKTEKQTSRYTNRDNDPRGLWKAGDVLRNEVRDYAIFPITLPSGREVFPPAGTSWRYTKEKFADLIADNRIWFGVAGDAKPAIKRFITEVAETMPPTTIWKYDEVGHNDEAKKESKLLFQDSLFGTPKPERLIQRILQIATDQNDLVLDSFLGSGTTVAVAHKMGRRYIGIEIGSHAETHCVPRLKKVVEGELGGISKVVNWCGGSGFRFYRLGEPIFDGHGRVNPAISYTNLAAHIWFTETHTPLNTTPDTPLIGVHNGVAYYLLFNGILGDMRPEGGNVLTSKTLSLLPSFEGPKVVFGESSRFGPERLDLERITFKQIPYDIKAR